jgi:hypothetical protein
MFVINYSRTNKREVIVCIITDIIVAMDMAVKEATVAMVDVDVLVVDILAMDMVASALEQQSY